MGPSAVLFYSSFVSQHLRSDGGPLLSIHCAGEKVVPHHRSGEAGGGSSAQGGCRFGQHA